jgi:signal transduction histidine kinase
MFTQTSEFYTSFLAGLLFLTVLLGMMLLSILRQFRHRIRESKAQLSREIELVDAERRRMHRDLHDEFGSGLSAIGLLVQQLNPRATKQVPDKIFHEVQHLRTRIRNIAYDFAPPALESSGLVAAIQEYLDNVDNMRLVFLYRQISVNDKQFKISKCLHIYRIIREIMINALKHAQCTRIIVSLKETEKVLILQISDNGAGFDYGNTLQRREGSGLSHIQARAGLLEATMRVESSKGKGTSYHLQIPLYNLIQTNHNDDSN